MVIPLSYRKVKENWEISSGLPGAGFLITPERTIIPGILPILLVVLRLFPLAPATPLVKILFLEAHRVKLSILHIAKMKELCKARDFQCLDNYLGEQEWHDLIDHAW